MLKLYSARPLRCSNYIRLAHDRCVVDGAHAACLEFLASIDVARDNPVYLVLRGAKVVADQFAQDRSVIVGPFQIPAARAEHGTGRPLHPRNRVAGVTPEYAGAVAFVVTFD